MKSSMMYKMPLFTLNERFLCSSDQQGFSLTAKDLLVPHERQGKAAIGYPVPQSSRNASCEPMRQQTTRPGLRAPKASPCRCQAGRRHQQASTSQNPPASWLRRCRLGRPNAAMSSLTLSGMRLQQQRVAARPKGTHSGNAKLTASAQLNP